MGVLLLAPVVVVAVEVALLFMYENEEGEIDTLVVGRIADLIC